MNRNITYTEKEGYLYPDLELPEQKEAHIGIWGQRRRRYLKKHRKLFYLELLTSCRLSEHLAETDRQAQELMDRIVNDTKEIRGITEKLKAEDPMRWVGEMNNIFSLAEDIVMEEVIYS